jgi:hypothetical protein
MAPGRGDFIRTTSTAAALLAVQPGLLVDPAAQTPVAPAADSAVLDLAHAALNSARSAGAPTAASPRPAG